MKILFGVLTTEKYHSTRCYNIQATWGKDQSVAFLTDKRTSNNNYICCTDRCDYQSVYIKVISALKFFYQLIDDFDWFYICDDDAYIFTKTLQNYLKDFDTNHPIVCGEIKNTLSEDLSLFYPLGGAGCVLSKETIKRLYKHISEKQYKINMYGDVTLGYLLKDCQITLINDRRFHSQRPDHFEYGLDINKHLITNISFHYIDAEWSKKLNEMEKQ
jgi:hypothetical protein